MFSFQENVLHWATLSSKFSILIVVLQNVLQFTIFNLRGKNASKKAQIDLPCLEKLPFICLTVRQGGGHLKDKDIVHIYGWGPMVPM